MMSHDHYTMIPIFVRQQELEEIKTSGLKSFRDILIDEANILIWTGLIVPVCTFRITMGFNNRRVCSI